MSAARPARRYPARTTIAKQWEHPVDTCTRCDFTPIVALLERAHLITRSLGGLDTVTNFVLLCRNCHADMPNFEPGDEEIADAWVEMTPDEWFAAQIDAIAYLIERGAVDPTAMLPENAATFDPADLRDPIFERLRVTLNPDWRPLSGTTDPLECIGALQRAISAKLIES